ncbi:hypothetical protein [Galactobacter valiniphilus]|nr:hypothetical protein [Galactobacter valiniphilus]
MLGSLGARVEAAGDLAGELAESPETPPPSLGLADVAAELAGGSA